ncbi:hypothetical protein TNCV_3991681 [Trichonephila clavipes]|uniref:Uncharacterized protein n=1 Tax=Trichonephila clavipes TaxID=2585209 RepID=A0A8X6VP58_TRICX|nr:hypothetical protein TNCV_3991681 [Trichonephila clavipes]
MGTYQLLKMRQRYSGYCQEQLQKQKWVQVTEIQFVWLVLLKMWKARGQSFESEECGCEQLTHFCSRLQSVEACPTDAHLEHVNYPRREVFECPNLWHLKQRREFAISSMFRLGKTRPLSGYSSIGSISTRKHLRSGVPPPTTESNKRGSVPVICNVSSGTPKRGITSRLTGAGSLLPEVYSEAWVKFISRTPFSSLRNAAHGKQAGWLTNGVNRTQIKQHNQNIEINLRKETKLTQYKI